MINIEKIRKGKPIAELLKFSIINIDKPSGPTSFQVSQFVKNSLGVNKTSHFGTLDPAVSGVLPVALGRACRLSDYFMHRDKTYVGIMRMHEEVSDEELKRVMTKFLGKIKQTPPVRSRVKRAERIREVKTFKILEREDKDILFETQVQAGTYIRKLIHDMGDELQGAHMLELRRVKAGIFEEQKSVNLYEFEKAVIAYKNGNEKELREILIPGEKISEILPVLQIHKQELKKCLAGSPIFSSFILNAEEIKKLNEYEKICVFCEEQFVGCYCFIGNKNPIRGKLRGIFKPQTGKTQQAGGYAPSLSNKDLIAKPEFVFN